MTTMVTGFLMILPLMFSIFSSFWTSASTASDASTSTPLHVPTLQGTSSLGPSVFDQVDGESTPNEAIPESADAAGVAGAALMAGTATSSHLPVTGPHATDASGMPFFETPADLPFPSETWSPEAMLTWMYNRCLRRLDGCVGEDRRTLYQQRLGVLREVMQVCRSSDPEAHYAASVMTRNMQDLSEDERSPLHQMSLIQVVNEMDAAERVFNIGSAISDTVHASSSNDHPTESRHVNAVANQLMSMLDGEPHENPEEENQSDSDEVMETEIQRR